MSRFEKSVVFLSFLLLLTAGSFSILGFSIPDPQNTCFPAEEPDHLSESPLDLSASFKPDPENFPYETIRKLPVRIKGSPGNAHYGSHICQLFLASKKFLKSTDERPLALTVSILIFPFDYFW